MCYPHSLGMVTLVKNGTLSSRTECAVVLYGKHICVGFSLNSLRLWKVYQSPLYFLFPGPSCFQAWTDKSKLIYIFPVGFYDPFVLYGGGLVLNPAL